ncbi:MAG: 16S rRNA (cytidine(1402)-2'-O)-methyltransferase [Alphaproteobacteria bacterium]|nr:16S rRNA (cytidine(1402)-2'-O)-methyltransferase [Alphaproteobacteria bacterium]
MQISFFSPKLIESISDKIRQQKDKPGLYLVATPIGNLFDISLRALNILKKSKIIFAEDTRNSRKLLNFYEIDTPLVACHEYNEIMPAVVEKIERGEIYSLISDAGTPTISDPGYRLVNWCVENGIEVVPIPGACAFIAGLCGSGLPTDRFTFCGFLPSKQHARQEDLKELKSKTETLIFLESPKRISDSLKDMREIFGDRHCCICRELTKLYEDFQRGPLSKIIKYFSENEPTGEFVVIISGNKEEKIDETKIFSELSELLQKFRVKEAVEIIVEKYSVNKKAIYQKALEIKDAQN